jgi:hypothetical protein
MSARNTLLLSSQLVLKMEVQLHLHSELWPHQLKLATLDMEHVLAQLMLMMFAHGQENFALLASRKMVMLR